MRVLSACLAIAVAVAACATNPDPRNPSLQFMQKKGFGGWIEIKRNDGSVLRGELLAIDGNTIWVQTPMNQTASIGMKDFSKAELYPYESESGFGLWGTIGTLSTVSHGVWLVFTVPLWILISSVTAADESRHMILRIPGNKIEDLSKWARYPQGMPNRSNPDNAWKLTLQAEQAARADRCDVVVALGPQVRELDPGLHEATFMRDEAIRRCLGLPSLLVPSMPVPSAPPDAGIAAPDADASAPAAPAPAP